MLVSKNTIHSALYTFSNLNTINCIFFMFLCSRAIYRSRR